METQTKCCRNKRYRNIKETAKIIALLKIHKITQRKIAEDLNITYQAVNRSINGYSPIAKVNNWLKENLGI